MEKRTYTNSASQDCLIVQDKFSIHHGMCQIPIFFTVDQEIDIELFKKAINIEIERNDALRDKISTDKKKSFFNQTFVEPYNCEDYNGKFEVYNLSGKTKEEQDKILKKLACTVLDYANFNLIKIAFFNKTFDGKFGIFFAVSHMVCDAWGAFITLTDLLDVYVALKNNTEMPKPLASFEECLAKDIDSQTPEKDEEDLRFMNDYWKSFGIPKRCSGIIDKRLPYKKNEGKNAGNSGLNQLKSLIFDKSENFFKVFPKSTADKWIKFCEDNKVPFNSLILGGLMAYCAKINNDNDLIIDNICNRRATLADKHSAGCRMSCLFLRLIPNDTDTAEQLLSNITNMENQFFRHSGVSVMKSGIIPMRKDYDINSANYYGNAMLSVIAMPYKAPEGWNCHFDTISTGHYAQPEYIMAVLDLDGSLKFNVEYQLRRTNKIQVEASVNGIYDAINAIVADKSITFKQIKDSIK